MTSAQERDRSDPLRDVRNAFSLPPDRIYLDGNSLGALPTVVVERMQTVIEGEWGHDLITSWNTHG